METIVNTLVGFLISFGVLTPSTDTPPSSTDDEVANIEYSVDENRFEELKLAIETINALEEELEEAGEKLDLDRDGIVDVIEDDDDSDDDFDDDSDDDFDDESDDDFDDDSEDERGLGSIFLADNLADRIRGWDNMSERAKQRLQELKELKAREIIEDIEEVVEEEIVEDVIDEIVEEVIDEIVEEIEDIDDINDEFEADIKLAQAQIEEADTGTAREEALQHLESVLEQRQAATETARQAYSREATESIRELIPADVQDRLPSEAIEAIEAIENVTERVAERRAETQARSDNALANAQERDNEAQERADERAREAQERADERAREAQNRQNERGQRQPNQ